jgi:RNA-directed DNA polymerase
MADTPPTCWAWSWQPTRQGDGRFIVKRKTQSKRLTRKLTAMREEARRLMHRPLAEQHCWYASVLRGHYGYYGVPQNWRSLNGFLQEVRRIWFDCLCCNS